MSGFQKEVRTTARTQIEIDAERNDQRRSSGVATFVEATNAPDGGAFGYQTMLEDLFHRFESDHGTVATIGTVLEALKPLIGRHGDIGKLYQKFDQVVDSVSEN